MTRNYKDIAILLVDDDEIDVRAFRRGLQKQKLTNPIFVASDGVEALEILRGGGGHPKLSGPYLILLDINMPRMDGIQFLQELRGDPALADNTVFVLTTSGNDQDRLAAYRQQIAGYMIKADADENFQRVVQVIENYVTSAKSPNESAAAD